MDPANCFQVLTKRPEICLEIFYQQMEYGVHMSSLFSSIIWIPCIFYFPLFTIFYFLSQLVSTHPYKEFPLLRTLPCQQYSGVCLYLEGWRDLLHIQSKILCGSLHDSCSALMDTCSAQQNNQVIVKFSILGLKLSGRKGKDSRGLDLEKVSTLYWNFVS